MRVSLFYCNIVIIEMEGTLFTHARAVKAGFCSSLPETGCSSPQNISKIPEISALFKKFSNYFLAVTLHITIILYHKSSEKRSVCKKVRYNIYGGWEENEK